MKVNQTRSDSAKLTVRQRARKAARDAMEAERAKTKKVEAGITDFLVSLDKRDEAFARAGEAAKRLLELGESRKTIAEKTGTSLNEVARALQLVDDDSDASDGESGEDESGDELSQSNDAEQSHHGL